MQIYDKLWKGIIEDLCPDFLHFFFPDMVDDIDFSRPFEFLDQELALLFPESEGKNRAADKLIKIYLIGGDEIWLLLHIEVQGYYDATFPQRMYVSQYRIADRYDRKVVAMAIYTDKQKDYKPNVYETEHYGTKIRYEYRTYKVLDQDKTALEFSDNPFALVILATLAAIEKGEANDEELMNVKRNLVRLLIERKYTKLMIKKLFRFINHYIRFGNSKNYAIFAKEIQSNYFNEKKNMGIEEILIEHYKEEGIKEGIKEGREEAMLEKDHTFATNLIVSTDFDDAKIAALVGVDMEFIKALRQEIANQ
jgi:predicted transposase YdaD